MTVSSSSSDHPYYDVCIIGAGPAGLAALSAIQEDYSLNALNETQINRATRRLSQQRRRQLRVLVVDPHDTWLSEWERNFQTLDIQFLRSPCVAHCSYFDRNALLAYAMEHNRENELLETGCSSISSLQGTVLPQVGLWKLPSTQLFLDFSRQLAQSLPHTYRQGQVQSVTKDDNDDDAFRIVVMEQQKLVEVTSKYVILATGMVGRPIVPKPLQPLVDVAAASPNNKQQQQQRIYPWQQLDQAIKQQQHQKFLVVGGGLTAVQTALKLASSSLNNRVVLCSRRPLVERHLDIPLQWFDYREFQYHQAQFYHESPETKRLLLKQSRGGGTVPPLYMEQLRKKNTTKKIQIMVGDVDGVEEEKDQLTVRIRKSRNSTQRSSIVIHKENLTPNNTTTTEHTTTTLEDIHVDAIVLACGVQPDALSHPLLQSMHKSLEKKPLFDTYQGYPIVTEDLNLCPNVYVVGGLASLSVGPDAANLMGIARAAETVANAMNSKGWLREEEANVYRNPFDVFDDDSSDSSDSDSSDEEE